jgi:hypothetical protein
VDKKDDKRPVYTLAAWGGIVCFFVLMFLLTGSGGDSTPVPSEPPYLPDAGYETDGANGHGYEESSPQPRDRAHPVEV